MSVIICNDLALPRDIDVSVNVSKVQTELTTDLSVVCFATPNATFDPDANRIKFYSSLTAVAADFLTSSEAYKAATAFFSQNPRAKQMAVGRIFTAATKGYLKLSSVNTTLSAWTAISDGSFQVSVDGVSVDVTGCDFGSATDMDDVATVIQTKLALVAASATVVNVGSGVFKIVSGTTGSSSTVSFLDAVSPATGTDISGDGFLNGVYDETSSTQTGYAVDGYTPEDIAGELALIAEAARCYDNFVYGWVLDKTYRDDTDALTAAAYIETQTAIMGLCTNSAFAYDASSTTDIGYLINSGDYTRTFTVYHNNAYYYPEMAVLAYALSVNYALANSTITTKFKNLIGIPTVPMDETKLAALEAKNINTFTAVGNDARTFREGETGSSDWFIDDRINLDNFKEELQVAVYNVFLRNKKVPYTTAGVNLLRTAMTKICDRYVTNGTFADRPLDEDETQNDSPAVDPAYTITFTPIASMTAAERAARTGPPAEIKVNMAGAIHSIAISVEAYS